MQLGAGAAVDAAPCYVKGLGAQSTHWSWEPRSPDLTPLPPSSWERTQASWTDPLIPHGGTWAQPRGAGELVCPELPKNQPLPARGFLRSPGAHHRLGEEPSAQDMGALFPAPAGSLAEWLEQQSVQDCRVLFMVLP